MAKEEKEGQRSNLSNDILTLILKRLHTQLDLCRFRSICKSWRSFAISSQTHLLFPLSLPSIHSNSRPFSLYPTIIYLLHPPFNPNNVWLVKVSETGDNKLTLLNPLTNHKLYFPFGFFPKLINLMGFRNLEVGRSYKLQLVGNLRAKDNTFDFEGFSSMISLRKVVVGFGTFEGVSVLGLYENGQVGIWKSKNDKWKIVEMNPFDDIISHGRKFYAVDRQCRLVVIDFLSFEVNELVSPVEICNYNQYTYLVGCDYGLYLVVKIVVRPITYYDEEEEDWVVDKTNVGRPLAFKVFVFCDREKEWKRAESIGNKVFFVSRDASFSVCAEDLGWSEGNCIYFEGLTGYDDEADMAFGLNAGVYCMENHDIVTFSSLTDPKTRIFLPPSSWFV